MGVSGKSSSRLDRSEARRHEELPRRSSRRPEPGDGRQLSRRELPPGDERTVGDAGRRNLRGRIGPDLGEVGDEGTFIDLGIIDQSGLDAAPGDAVAAALLTPPAGGTS